MSRRSSSIGVLAGAAVIGSYLILGIAGALAGQKIDNHRALAFTAAFLAESARDGGNRAIATREVSDTVRAPTVTTGEAAPGATMQAMMPDVIPVFLQDRQFTSTLVLVNASAVSTYADVSLTARDGTTIVTRRVQFTPHSQQTIDVAAVLASAASTATSGSIEIMVSPGVQPSSIAAQLSITYSGGPDPNYIDEELEMPSMNTSSILRGVAERAKGSPIIGITSLSDSSQTVAIQCLGNDGLAASKTVSLLAGETLFTQACNAKTLYGADLETAMLGNDSAVRNSVGISLASTAKPGEFVAFGLAPQGDSNHAYFSGITFTDPKTLMSPNTTFTGVPMGRSTLLPDGTYVPELALANFSPTPARVRVKYAATSGTSTSMLDEGSLEVPGDTTRWVRLDRVHPLDSLQNSFVVDSDGAPGDVIAKMVSAGNSQLHEIELPAKDELDVNNSGAHPWTLASDNESTLLLFNHGDKANDVNVVISAGSATWEKAFRLASMQTMALSIRQVIQSGIKGDKGETLPTDAAVGMVEWFPGQSGGIAGRMLVSNRALAMARSFSCNQYEYLCAAEFSAFNNVIIDGEDVDFGSLVATICLGYSPCDKGGTPEYQGGSGYTYYWSSANTNIISISKVNSDGSVNTLGVAPGSTTVSGEVDDGTCDAEGGGPGSVVPSVTFTSLSPNPVLNGSTSTIQITITPSTTITLNLSSSGTGRATFSDGSQSMQDTFSGNVALVGSAASSGTTPDVTLSATYNGTTIAQTGFGVTTGACTSSWVGHGGQGPAPCPSTVTEYDTYNIAEYCSSCGFSCLPVNYDSSFSPQSCTTNVTQISGQIQGGETSKQTSGFSASDCNYHYLSIQTKITNAQGLVTNITPGSIGSQCTYYPPGTANSCQ